MAAGVHASLHTVSEKIAIVGNRQMLLSDVDVPQMLFVRLHNPDKSFDIKLKTQSAPSHLDSQTERARWFNCRHLMRQAAICLAIHHGAQG
jgi:hypothetical protein